MWRWLTERVNIWVVLASMLVAALVSADGESNWLEGATLLAVYFILGIAFFLLPTG